MDALSPVAHRLEQIRILVLTDGGHPLRGQQAQLKTLLQSVRFEPQSSLLAAVVPS
jgi:hypothetical protein